MTHDGIRHGTTTLFAALNVLDGTVIGQCMARHRHQEFIRFLNKIEAAVLAGKLVHADPRQLCRPQALQSACLAHPASALDVSLHAHFMLLGQCGREFLRLAHSARLQRGVFCSVVDLQAAINRYLGDTNRGKTKPFLWTADPDRIIENLNRGYQALASDH